MSDVPARLQTQLTALLALLGAIVLLPPATVVVVPLVFPVIAESVEQLANATGVYFIGPCSEV